MHQASRELFFTKTFHILAIFLFAGLFLTSLFITGTNGVNGAYGSEFVILEHHSLPRLLLITAVFGTAMFLLGLLYDKMLCQCNRNLLLVAACAIACLAGLYWVGTSGTAPQADQLKVVVYADLFNHGDFSGLQKGYYLASCGHLLGLVTLMRGFLRIFGSGNYFAFQYFNALMLPLIIFCGAHIVRKFSENNGCAEFYYLVLTLTCFPMYAYTAYVYGEVSSTAVVLMAAWLLISCLENFSVSKAVGLALASGIAVQLRRNTLIVLIAFGIVAIISLLRKPKWTTLATGLSVLAGTVMLQAVVSGIYSDVRDPEGESIPSILYVAMGLHDADGGPGYYDAYHFSTFENVGYDAELAKQIGFDEVKARIERFQSEPDYAQAFFSDKINSQWQAPMYQSIVMNNNIVREQSRIVQMIYQEEFLGKMVKLYMKAFQVFMYGSILFWLLSRRKDRVSIETYVLLIAVFGGFLFSIIWEAKTRYIFPYLLLMIPYFSMGIQGLAKWRLRKTCAEGIR